MCRLLIVLCLVLPSVAKACSYFQLKSFSLKEFDEAKVVVEIQVLSEVIEDSSKMFEDYALVIEKYKKSIMNWDKPYPPPPPPPQAKLPAASYTDFKIKVLSYYKGAQYKIDILRADIGSSCAWTPKIGQKYLIYVSYMPTEGMTNVIGAGACERKLTPSCKLYNYKHEKKVLKMLRKAKDGRFEIYNTIRIGNKEHKLLTLEGEFKNKVRQGVWTLYEPLMHREKVVLILDKVLILTYVDGKIIDRKYILPKDKYIHNSVTLFWNYYYEFDVN